MLFIMNLSKKSIDVLDNVFKVSKAVVRALTENKTVSFADLIRLRSVLFFNSTKR